jgi:hypothetical protein
MPNRVVDRFFGRTLLVGALVVSLLPAGALVRLSAAKAAADVPVSPGGCAGMTVPEENHASIRLRVDQPASQAQVSVDEHGNIAIGGIVHKHATMVDVSDGQVVSSDFALGPPPDGVAAWAASWTTSLRPPHLGSNQVCVRAKRDPKRSARILRSFTVVDSIPPSDVPDLAVGDITATAAKVTWGAATDNYGLAGYAVSIDGGTAHRTTVGTRSYTITGLTPSTHHSVSAVAIDLAGNTSTTPATTSFTTAAAPPPPSGDLTLSPEPGAATAVWHPDPSTDATYRVLLDDESFEDFTLEQYCQDANGKPANPCTSQDVISYPIAPLEQETPYTFRVEAVRADGTTSRSLSGSFTTTASEDMVPAETTQLIASDSSRCAGMGGDLYVSPDARAGVPIPAGATQVFDGCYTVPDSSCMDAFLPPSGNKQLNCSDDVTELLSTLAPPGRGPVISSLDDVAANARRLALPGVHTANEAITWCIHNDTCTTVVETAAEETAELMLEPVLAAVADAAVAVLEVLGPAIVLGLALETLYDQLFPGKIGLEGITEYAIDFNTDFDTFNNWGADEGKWIDSLKIYAEIIKTTDDLAGKRNLPFAWDVATDLRLKELIDGACAAQKSSQAAVAPCGHGFAVYVPGGQSYDNRKMPETGKHIVQAMGDGFPAQDRKAWFYPAYSKNGKAAMAPPFNYRPKWYNRPPFAPNEECSTRPAGDVCDEFPFWTTDQAVDLSGTRADLKAVPGAEASPQGTDFSGFIRGCTVADNERFLILPIKPWVEANGPSFGFRVDQGGASLCREPKPLKTSDVR